MFWVGRVERVVCTQIEMCCSLRLDGWLLCTCECCRYYEWRLRWDVCNPSNTIPTVPCIMYMSQLPKRWAPTRPDTFQSERRPVQLPGAPARITCITYSNNGRSWRPDAAREVGPLGCRPGSRPDSDGRAVGAAPGYSMALLTRVDGRADQPNTTNLLPKPITHSAAQITKSITTKHRPVQCPMS